MPELPEVETVRSQLSHYLPFKIVSQETSKVISGIAHTPLKLKNLTVTSIDRIGKLLIFNLDNKTYLLSHLGMTGTWLIGEKIIPMKHSHLILKSPTHTLIYDDPRRFGHLYHVDEAGKARELKKLGKDLTELTLDEITFAIKKYPERHLKVTLLDQKLFAGSGNYIASEICARAGIRPTRKCGKIKTDEFPKILKAIAEVLNPALKSGGTTFQGGYRDTSGEKGQGVNHLVVFYQKTCNLCKKTPVKKIILNGRGTYFCPHCQK
jgi:formamidopyrimidine-DNA glycosylase